MRDPFKVVLWGPGGLGRIITRELAARSDFKLVGVLAYSEDKAGEDVGSLAGIENLGVKATTSVDEALAIDCDVVLHATRDFGNYNSLDEIVRILSAGRNVVTVHAYHLRDVLKNNPAAPSDAVERIEAACRAGNSTFHCTGIHPEFVCNRLAGVLSGLSSEINSVEISETWDGSHMSRHQLEPLGFGAKPEIAATLHAATAFASNYALMNLNSVAKSLGVRYTRTETEHEHVPAPYDLPEFSNGMKIKAGDVARLTHRYTGYVDNVPKPFYVKVEVNWMLGRGPMRPDNIKTDDYYTITIEGRPSLRLALDIQGSFATGEHFVVPGDPTSEPGYHATVMTMLQNIPRVVVAPSGWLDMVHPVPHWAPDFRDSWNTTEADALSGK
jgi:4-hydroxy-tetrahydrodipicolinate reductase